MSNPIEAAFEPLHITLARLRLLVRLTDENITLDAAGQQCLSEWLDHLATLAAAQAIHAEQEVAASVEVSTDGNTQARV